MDWINLPFIQGGAVIVLLATIWAMISGRIYPKSYVDELRKEDRETIQRQEQEIQEWRTAWIAESMIKRELVSHISDLMETGKITRQLLEEIAKGRS